MQRRTSVLISALLLMLLVGSVFLQAWFIPHYIGAAVARFPEVEPLATPGLVWGILVIASLQAVIFIGLHLVVLARKDRFEDAAGGWLRAVVGSLLAFVVLLAAAFVGLTALGYGTVLQAELVILGVVALIATGLIVASPMTRRSRKWRSPLSREQPANS